MIFVDTGAWFASFVPNDSDHKEAYNWLEHNDKALITSDYIIDELLTLLRVRGESQRALIVGEQLISSKVAIIEHVTLSDFQASWETFKKYKDKQWSFTDCTSKAIMQRLKISQAFAFDDHFNQFGNIKILP